MSMQQLLKDYRSAKAKLDELENSRELVEAREAVEAFEDLIKAEVKVLGKSQKAEGVKISYRKGQARVDYEKAALALSVPLSEFTKVETVCDYTQAVKSANLDKSVLEPFTKVGSPSVKIEIED